MFFVVTVSEIIRALLSPGYARLGWFQGIIVVGGLVGPGDWHGAFPVIRMIWGQQQPQPDSSFILLRVDDGFIRVILDRPVILIGLYTEF